MEIGRNFVGVWRLMMGKPDGLKLLDVSADGVWNSFAAILVSFPAALSSWMVFARNEAAQQTDAEAARAALLPIIGLADYAGWLFPLAGFALLAKTLGLSDRLSAFLVASNWGNALTFWLIMPYFLCRLMLPLSENTVLLMSFAILIITLVLGWRLVNATLARGPVMATAVFLGLFITNNITFALFQPWLGLTSP